MKPIRVRVPADIADMIPRYLGSRRADLERLRAALAEPEWELLHRIGHTLHGNGAGYGFAGISEIGAALAAAAKAHDQPQCQAQVAALADYLERLEWVEDAE